MYLTCWKYLGYNPETSWNDVNWSSNCRVTDSYFSLVLDDGEVKIDNKIAKAYHIKQYIVDPATNTMALIHEEKKEIKLSQPRVINS